MYNEFNSIHPTMPLNTTVPPDRSAAIQELIERWIEKNRKKEKDEVNVQLVDDDRVGANDETE